MFRYLLSSISNRVTSGAVRDGTPLINNDIDNDISLPTITPVQVEPIPSITNTLNVNCLHDTGTHLRAKLRFFFMSPCWKWHLKRQFSWKAWFQFIKIIIVTTQVKQNIAIYFF